MSLHGSRRFVAGARVVGGLCAATMLAATLFAASCAQPAAPPPRTAATAAQALATGTRPTTTSPAAPAGEPLRLVPATEARPLLLAAIAIPSVDHTLSGATTLLSRAVPLPLDAAGIKEMLLTQAGLPSKVGENLDTASPAGAVVVAIGGKEVAGLVMAIPAKGVEQARAVIAALGRVVAHRGEVIQVDNGTGGRGWVWQSGNVIVLSDSVDALGRGAMLALDARRAGHGEDVTAVLYPGPIARANGTDLKTALSVLVSMARAAQEQAAKTAKTTAKTTAAPTAKTTAKPAPGDAPDQPDHSLDVLEDLAGYLGDTNTVEIALTLDEGRGLMATLRIHPLPGTPFETLTTEGHPFAIDPALLRHTDDIATVFASSYGPFFRAQIARQRQRLQEQQDKSHDKGGPAALQFFDASMAAIEGSWSGVGELRPSLALQIVYPLKDQAAAAKLSAAMFRLDAAAALAIWKAQVGAYQQGMFDWKIKKETVGKLKAAHYILTFDQKGLQKGSQTGAGKGLTPAGRDAIKKLLGGPSFDVYSAVAGTRMLVTGGKNARAKLLALASDDDAATKTGAKSGTASGAKDPAAAPSRLVVGPNGDLVDATAAAQGKDSFGYFDLGQVIGLVGSLADEPRARAVAAGATAPIPTYVTFGTDAQGKVMAFSWTITPSAFSGAGAILQGLGGGMMK